MRKFFFAVLAALALIAAGCSFSEQETGSVTFRADGYSGSRGASSESRPDGLVLRIWLNDNEKDYKEVRDNSSDTATFEGIAVGTKVRARAFAYTSDASNRLYEGESEEITVSAGDNQIKLVMKKAKSESKDLGPTFRIKATTPDGVALNTLSSEFVVYGRHDSESTDWTMVSSSLVRKCESDVLCRVFSDHQSEEFPLSAGFKVSLAVFEDYASGDCHVICNKKAWEYTLYYYDGDEIFEWDGQEDKEVTVTLTKSTRTEALPKLTATFSASDSTNLSNKYLNWVVSNGINEMVCQDLGIEISSNTFVLTPINFLIGNASDEAESILGNETYSPKLAVAVYAQPEYNISYYFYDGNWYNGSSYCNDNGAVTWDGTSDSTMSITLSPTPSN